MRRLKLIFVFFYLITPLAADTPFHPVYFTEVVSPTPLPASRGLPGNLHVTSTQFQPASAISPQKSLSSVSGIRSQKQQTHVALPSFLQQLEARIQSPPPDIDVPAELYLPADALSAPVAPSLDRQIAQKNLAQRREAPPSATPVALGTFEDHQYLADLASEYQARANAQPRGGFYGKVLRDRAIACQLAVQHSEARFRAHAHQPPPGFAELFPALTTFGDFEGNFAQRRLCSELGYCVSRAFEQYRSNPITDQFSGIAPTVLQLATTARHADDPAVGFHLADSCFHLLEAGKHLATLCRGVKTGTQHFVIHSLQLAKSILTRPWDTTKEFIYGSIKAAGLAVGCALVLSIDNPTVWEREVQFTLIDKAVGLAKTAYYDPEATIATITEIILSNMALTGVLKLCRTGAASATRALTDAAQTNFVFEDARRAFLKMVGTPLPVPAGVSLAEYEANLAQYETILHSDASIKEVVSKIKAALEQEKIFAAGGTAAEQLAKENAILNPAGSALTEGIETITGALSSTLAQQALELAKSNRLRKNISHLLKGEINKSGKLTGYHSSSFAPGAVVENLGTIDAFGSQQVVIRLGERVRETTIFNPSFNLTKICSLVDEAVLNPVPEAVGDFGCIGRANNGQLIALWFIKPPSTETITINSFYPVNATGLKKFIEKIAKRKRG